MNARFLWFAALAMFVAQSVCAQESSAAPLGMDSSKTSPAELEKRPRQTATPCGRYLEVCDVLDQYAVLTQKRIIRDNFVQGKVVIDDLTGAPKEKAIEVIERTLFANGYTLVQLDPDTIQAAGLAQNTRSIGLPIITDVKELPRGERVFSYVFRFKHRKAVEMQQILGAYLSPPRHYTSMLAEPEGNTLLVTERTSVIRTLLKIAAEMDVPAPTPVKSPAAN